jgi:hypothetical protein
MLTRAEEMGLSGLNLAARVRKAFDKIPEEMAVRLIQCIHEESTRRHLIYLRDGQLDTIRVLPLPLTVLPDQLAYFHSVSLTVQNALKRLPELYLQVLGDRQTRMPDGQTGGLLDFVRREQEILVLKPNRAYGGEGVTIGSAVTRAEWESALERALADKEHWVVQRLASIPVSVFPVIGPDGGIHVEPFHVMMGFAATRDGVAILGRASQKQVVNVAQRGGMCGVMIGHPPGRLYGPDTPAS